MNPYLHEPVDPPVFAPILVNADLFDFLAETEGAVIEASGDHDYVTTRAGTTYFRPRDVAQVGGA